MKECESYFHVELNGPFCRNDIHSELFFFDGEKILGSNRVLLRISEGMFKKFTYYAYY